MWLEAIWAALPNTTRGQPTVLSTDPKGERIAYAVRKQRQHLSKCGLRLVWVGIPVFTQTAAA